MKKSYIIAISVVLMIAAFLAGSLAYKNQKNEEQTALVNQHSAALEKFHSPRLGDPKAKVTIVEFFDPACETCRLFHPYVKDLLKQHQGKVKLVVRYNPLHQGSDYVVKILQAAKKQGRFWDVLELMYATQPRWAAHHQPQPQLIWEFLDYYKFDTARLKKDMNDPAFVEVINTDLADATLLGANKTPTYFVNGKPLPSFGLEQLQTLVASEIAEKY